MPTPLSESDEYLVGTIGDDVVDVVEQAAGTPVAVVGETSGPAVKTIDTGRVGPDPEIADRIFVDAVHLNCPKDRPAVCGRR